ncbi:MAG: putative sulfate exporter family transporter [Clostridiales bacterium]|nr:putative sulfate exporter family transporter [Clostridiales bacterium]
MKTSRNIFTGVLLSAAIAAVAFILNDLLPLDLIGTAILSLILGMLLNPLFLRHRSLSPGVDWTSKTVLRVGIICAGVTLSFAQVLKAGKYALILMLFTLTTAFGVGYICKRIFKINWKLASLLSISTAICGGTAVATLGPTIEAEDRDIAYAISATFIFDLLTVIAFPWIGMMLGLGDTGYGLWIGTSVNDTSSVVAAGYAFSDTAGALATIVKLTRTLFIVPLVLVFSWLYARKSAGSGDAAAGGRGRVNVVKIFPWFILLFLVMVGIRSTGILSDAVVSNVSLISKFCLAMALAAIGMKTSLREVRDIGPKPMVAGVIIDTSVVIVALVAQAGILHFIK